MDNNTALHIVMFPWLAMGHLIPFLHLSKCLAKKGHRVSFISTTRNIQRLPKTPSEISSLIELVSFPLAKVDDLPDQAESSMDIPFQKAQFLKIAFDLLRSPVANFLRTQKPKPNWIIYDYASHWLPQLADDFGISKAYFSLFNAANMAFIGPPPLLITGEDGRTTADDFTVVPKWIPFESNIVYHRHEVMKYVEGSTGNESGTSDSARFGYAVHGSDVVLFRTCVEFESEWFNFVAELYKKPILSVGVLPPSLEDDELDSDESWPNIQDWLDKQKVNSVVYIALGTEAVLSRGELTELAFGLEQCGLPFFWVLRSPPGSKQNVSLLLPNGFEQRVKGRGLVHKQWAPQVQILSHPAIGGFLTHCGWNSVIEGLSFGRVLIMFPVMNDQGLNARLLDGKKVGIEISRNAEDGFFTSDSVAESIKFAITSPEGELIRDKAREMRGLFGSKGRNQNSVDSFVRYLEEKTISTQNLKS